MSDFNITKEDKLKFLSQETEKLHRFLENAMSDYNDYPVIPESIQTFTDNYFIGLRSCLEAL